MSAAMRATLVALVAGLLFGAGLTVSGMASPSVVLAFLTLDAHWNPALMFVMGGALAVTVPGFAWLRRRGRPLFDTRFHEPTARRIEAPLLVGAALFGLGWGLVGYCPGPAVVGAGQGQAAAWLFLPAMLIGAALANRWTRRAAAAPAADGAAAGV